MAILANDSEFGPALNSKKLEPYAPMPPVTDDPSAKGRPERTVTVGLFSTSGNYQHEVVGVNMVRRAVVRFPNGAPPTSNAADLNCGVPSVCCSGAAMAEAPFEIVISRDGTEFWRFLVIRPAGSSGDDKRKKNWVVENSVTGEAVVIEPGPLDGNTDKYGQGDVWFLRNRFPLEIDDTGQPPNDCSGQPPLNCASSARLNPMVNGESIANQDVVVWYAGHMRHELFDGPTLGSPNFGNGPTTHGPTLRLMKY